MMMNIAESAVYRSQGNDSESQIYLNSSTEPLHPKKMQSKRSLNYIEPMSLFKYIGIGIMFSLMVYAMWNNNSYFKKTSVRLENIEQSIGNLENDNQQQSKQLTENNKSVLEFFDGIIEVKEELLKKLDNLQSYDNNNGDETSNQCDLIPINLRFDCHPEESASEVSCNLRGCCWNPLHATNHKENNSLDVPYCYYPKNWALYKYRNFSKHDSDFSSLMLLNGKSFYGNDLPIIQFDSISIDDSILRVKIFDPNSERYEPPVPLRKDYQPFERIISNSKYSLTMDENMPGFKIIRSDDAVSIFNSIGIGGFVFADQFLQLSSTLPSHLIYGLGEHRSRLKLNTNWHKITFFNGDQPPVENANLYGSHPFYLAIEPSGKAHGVLFLNSNAMDVILQPTPAITFRSTGGIFDIYFFLGPTPSDVLKQYSEIVGKPFFPPYWSLGFHLCRFGYSNLENTRAVWKRNQESLIPFDTQWNDIDYMDKYNDFTYDKQQFKDLPKFIEKLHSVGMHYIPIIDAGVSASEKRGTYLPYDEGVQRGIFIRHETNNEPFKGKVWNLNSTTWPDFTHPNSTEYYTEMLNVLHNEIAFDGAWLDMNEPSNFYDGHSNGCQKSNLENPPYLPDVNGKLLAHKTVCMGAKHFMSTHYNLHNTYGTTHAIATNKALKKIRQKRPFIISRSTWVGHGAFAGHWTGDVYSTWHDLKMSIPEMLAFGLYQIPMVGADICGFNGNTTEALCNRWMQLGAFYPFSRNHNSDDTIEQDPAAMGQLVINSSRNALRIRYYLLPYLYTLFYKSHISGETVARPLFIEFNEDDNTYAVDTQFLWGSCLMINPVLEEGKTDVTAYIPRGPWYDYYSKESFFSRGKNYTLDAALDTIPLLIRGGCILPAQGPETTTTYSRKLPLELLIALDDTESAQGDLYWDDGDSLDSIEKKQYKFFKFEAFNNTLQSHIIGGELSDEIILRHLTILGVSKTVRSVFLNGGSVPFDYNRRKHVLKVYDIPTNLQKSFNLTWSNKEVPEEKTTSIPMIKVDVSNSTTEKSAIVNSANVHSSLATYFELIFHYMVIKYCISY